MNLENLYHRKKTKFFEEILKPKSLGDIDKEINDKDKSTDSNRGSKGKNPEMELEIF